MRAGLIVLVATIGCGRLGYDFGSSPDADAGPGEADGAPTADATAFVIDGFYLVDSATLSSEVTPRTRADGDLRGDVEIEADRFRGRVLRLRGGLAVGEPITIDAALEIDGDVWLVAAEGAATVAYAATTIGADRIELEHAPEDPRNTTNAPLATNMTLVRAEQAPDPALQSSSWVMTELIFDGTISAAGVCVPAGDGGSATYSGSVSIDENFFLEYFLSTTTHQVPNCASDVPSVGDRMTGFFEAEAEVFTAWLTRYGEVQIRIEGRIDEDNGIGRKFSLLSCAPDSECADLPDSFMVEAATSPL